MAIDDQQQTTQSRFGLNQKNRKKTLVDIELDADSDLEDFENNNLLMKIRGVVKEDISGEDEENES